MNNRLQGFMSLLSLWQLIVHLGKLPIQFRETLKGTTMYGFQILPDKHRRNKMPVCPHH